MTPADIVAEALAHLAERASRAEERAARLRRECDCGQYDHDAKAARKGVG